MKVKVLITKKNVYYNFHSTWYLTECMLKPDWLKMCVNSLGQNSGTFPKHAAIAPIMRIMP